VGGKIRKFNLMGGAQKIIKIYLEVPLKLLVVPPPLYIFSWNSPN